ncbi:tyrosine-type recombinase/integrase [Aneurinibacillus thermoaerophilus]|uniref:tyrosine-type recombinase/integrase n=1 Tax=Aneurinibacillus thermoaerophilus TaxID=143495 RepID=UPI00399C82A6
MPVRSKKHAQDVELPVIRFHDLRHTHATILLQLSENPKVVSERLGHVNITITLDTYSHILPDMQKNLAQNFDVAMKNPVKRNTKSALVD